MTRMTGFLTLLVLIGLTTVGCSRPYVNIPPQPGAVAAHDPNAWNVQEIQVVALDAVIKHERIRGPVQIKLPDGTTTLTYESVLPRVSDRAIRPGEGEAPNLLLVEGIRIRGWDGYVDIVRPISGGHDQVMTVTLDYRWVNGWTARDIQRFRRMANPDGTSFDLSDETPVTE